MLKIFLSSTFRDLKDYRINLLKQINSILYGIGMETFTPSGEDSQYTCLKNIDECDIVIFLISPYYGSFIEECKMSGCTAQCPLKQQSEEKISYTHCEYKYTISKGKKHFSYQIDEEWGLWEFIYQLSKITNEEELKNAHYSERLLKLSPIGYKHYLKILKNALSFRSEIRKKELIPTILINNVEIIMSDLFLNIIEWYNKGEISFEKFTGRKKELSEIIEKMNESLEIYGVGGIGKTSLIQIALMLNKIKGMKIVSIGQKQAYFSGSGYSIYKQKLSYTHNSIFGTSISLHDVLEALNLGNYKNIEQKEQISRISKKLDEEKIFLFIDDFHLAETELFNLVKNTNKIIIASRKKQGIARGELHLRGLIDSEKYEFIKSTAEKFNVELNRNTFKKISSITEGHPISIEILIRNYQRIDFDKIEKYKQMLDLSKNEHVEEFFSRVIKDILSSNSFSLLKALAILNPIIETNLNKRKLKQASYSLNFDEDFNELLDAGFIRKKINLENLFEFSFHHIQESLKDINMKAYHEKAQKYYEQKMNSVKRNLDDEVERLFHETSINSSEEQLEAFLKFSDKVPPNKKSYFTLFEIGKLLLESTTGRYRGIILIILGQLYCKNNDFHNAELCFNDAIKTFELMLTLNENQKRIDLAQVLTDYSNMLYKKNDIKKAKKLAQRAKVLFLTLPINLYNQIYHKIAPCYTNLGNIHHILGEFDQALEHYHKAKEYYYKSTQEDYIKYLSNIALAHNNLGNLLLDLENIEGAKNEYEQAIKIKRKLIQKEPELHIESYIIALNNFGVFDQTIKKYEELEKLYTEAFTICKNLLVQNPNAYSKLYIDLSINLVLYYHNIRKYDKSIMVGDEIINFIQNLKETHQDIYNHDIAIVYLNLAVTYRTLENFDKAENLINQAIKICNQLCQKNQKLYFSSYLKAKSNLAELYINTERVNEGVNILEEIHEYYILQLPDEGIATQIALATGYKLQKRLNEAIVIYLEIVKHYLKKLSRGVYSQNDLLFTLEKIIEISENSLKVDISLIRSVILYYMKKESIIPVEGKPSPIGKELKNLLLEKVKKGDNKIDAEIGQCIEDILLFYSSQNKL